MAKYKINLLEEEVRIINLLNVISREDLNEDEIYKYLKKNTNSQGYLYSKNFLTVTYKRLKKLNKISLSDYNEKILYRNLRMKKIRTISGVTPVTVLTKPFPCPGQCIFCPSDVRMPKSYLSDEPGAQRALQNKFDPYLQTFNRLVAFRNNGHPTDKVELLILGGTWSVYKESYQIWFIKRCFDALNDFGEKYNTQVIPPDLDLPFDEKSLTEIEGSNLENTYNEVISKALAPKIIEALNEETATWEELFKVHKANETSETRCIGLVIETRPDEIDIAEITRIRKLGATRVQIGIQSLNDTVLKLNKRGHDVAKTKEALNLLRQGGFKILAHWMPNLYGSNPEMDIKDFDLLFNDLSIKPDELKIYPCSLIKSAELMKYYRTGDWKPYTQEELLEVVKYAILATPRYCRLNRVIRDIPSTDIVVGNKRTNFRQIAENAINKSAPIPVDIRSREIRNNSYNLAELRFSCTPYTTAVSKEKFLEFLTSDDKVVAFLRLSLPNSDIEPIFDELKNASIIREIHVYGKSVEIGTYSQNNMQHKGLGKSLIKEAIKISKKAGFNKIAVISSVGTRKYYQKRGFHTEGLYQVKCI